MTKFAQPTKWPRSRYLLLVLLLITLSAVIAAMIIEKRVTPVLRAWAETKAVNLATEAIYSAVEETMIEEAAVADLAEIIMDDSGRIQAVKYNTAEINRVSATAAKKMLEHLRVLSSEQITIPLGQILGPDFLSGYGPGIPLKVVPVGAVSAAPVSSFTSAGINQTIHRLYLDIQVEMRVVIPLSNTITPVTARIPIAEDIFIGAVPSWYFAPSGLVGGFDQDGDFSGSQKIEFRLNEP